MTDLLEAVLADLAAESEELRDAVTGAVAAARDAGRPEEAVWHAETPAAGWDVATQVAHLTQTDEAAAAAARAAGGDPAQGADWAEVVRSAVERPDTFVDDAAALLAGLSGEELLARWEASRPALADALRAVPAGQRLPWFGPPMSPTSMATARFMETWAHGQDVLDGLEAAGLLPVRPAPTDRLRHVAHLGVRTRDFAYAVHQLAPPAEEFRVELTAPSGAVWTWGPEDAAQRVSGPALDFCLLVTQRVHPDDADVEAVGADARHWLSIAQAFAGPAGAGREKR